MSGFDRPAFCITLDGDGVVRESYSGTGLDQLGFDTGDMVGRSIFELVDRDSRAGEQVVGALAGETRRATLSYSGHTFRIWYVPETSEGSVERVRCLVLDVTEETHRRELLTVLNRVLRHNLRNKLTVVMGAADELQDDYPDDGRPDRIVEAGADLLTLTSKVRRMAVFADGGPGLDPVPLERLVESALDHLTALADTATVETDLPAESVAVPRGLEPALIELIENAIEHNGPPRRVRIEASTTDGIRDLVRLDIADNGPGLSTDDRRVLEGGEERPLSHASSIGLWLARWACESAATEVSVDETDTGTVIRLEIPANR